MITWKLAETLMDCIACMQLSGQGEINEVDVKNTFMELCNKYGITKVEED